MVKTTPFLLLGLLGLAIFVLLERLGVPAFRAAATHWFLFLPALVLALGMAGLVGKALGLQNLFHDDPALQALYGARHGGAIWLNSPALVAQALVTGSLVHVWGFAFTLGIDGESRALGENARAIMTGVAGCMILNLVCGTVRVSGSVGLIRPGEALRAAAGAALGVGYAALALGLAVRIEPALAGLRPEGGVAGTLALGLPAVAASLALLWYPKLLPAMALGSLAVTLNTLYAAASLLPEALQLAGVLAVLGWLGLANGGLDLLRGREPRIKFRVPGIVDAEGTSRYAPGNRLDLARFYPSSARSGDAGEFRQESRDRAPGNQVDPARAREAASGRIAPLDALEAWVRRVGPRAASVPEIPGIGGMAGAALARARAGAEGRARSEKPKLVLVATSGGAYRAAFWTGIVLDALGDLDRAGVLPGFAANVRLVTGASGGMVGGAYFAAMATPDGAPPPPVCDAIEADILAVQSGRGGYPHPTRFPIPRDSLSPVAQRLVQRDLPGLFWPGVRAHDRGTVLEDQWARLDTSFAALRDGEREGWRPSLIFAPMLAETGQPLLVSNLDMDLVRRDAYGETVQFFDWFPEAQESFRVKTAARLNASFPYIAPAAALPTRPYRRVVDAGYYDNYGVDLAATYLARPEIRDWVLARTSGVIVLQLRAFPFALPLDDEAGPVGRAVQAVTTPVEAALAARGSTMTFRNRQSLRQVRIDYRDRAYPEIPQALRPDFVESVSFEVDSETSMSWYLPGRELADMRARFLDEPRQACVGALIEAWWR